MHPGVQFQDPFTKYRIHSVDGENGVNLLFLVLLILFRDMREEIDSRIFDPPSLISATREMREAVCACSGFVL